MFVDFAGKRHAKVTETGIYGFFGDYRFLSNFHLCEVEVLQRVFPSAEHAYAAFKTKSRLERDFIATIQTPRRAKEYGATLALRPGWDTFRLVAMQRCLAAKFDNNTFLKSLLLGTGDKYLEESNNWGDTFWGVHYSDTGRGVGANHLGKFLMALRSQYRKSCHMRHTGVVWSKPSLGG